MHDRKSRVRGERMTELGKPPSKEEVRIGRAFRNIALATLLVIFVTSVTQFGRAPLSLWSLILRKCALRARTYLSQMRLAAYNLYNICACLLLEVPRCRGWLSYDFDHRIHFTEDVPESPRA